MRLSWRCCCWWGRKPPRRPASSCHDQRADRLAANVTECGQNAVVSALLFRGLKAATGKPVQLRPRRQAADSKRVRRPAGLSEAEAGRADPAGAYRLTSHPVSPHWAGRAGARPARPSRLSCRSGRPPGWWRRPADCWCRLAARDLVSDRPGRHWDCDLAGGPQRPGTLNHTLLSVEPWPAGDPALALVFTTHPCDTPSTLAALTGCPPLLRLSDRRWPRHSQDLACPAWPRLTAWQAMPHLNASPMDTQPTCGQHGLSSPLAVGILAVFTDIEMAAALR